MIKTEHIHVDNVKKAWEKADKVFPYDYLKDDEASERAGYEVYRSTAKNFTNAWWNYICDLGNRLEVNLCDSTGHQKVINIWIDFVEKTSKGYRICSAE